MIEGTVISPPVSFPPSSQSRLFVGTLLLLLSALYPVNAVETVDIHLGNLSGPGWQLEGLRLKITWAGDQDALFSLSADHITYAKLPLAVQSVRIECREGAVSDRQIRCDRGVAHLDSPLLDNKEIPLRLNWERTTQNLDLRLEKLALSEGYASVDANWNGRQWQARVSGSGLSLAQLLDDVALL